MPSIVTLLPVMTALVGKLSADATLVALLAPAPDAGAGIYNEVYEGAKRPYIVVDGGTEVPFNTLGTLGAAKWGGNTTVQVKAITEGAGDAEGLAILSRAKTVLDGQPMTVPGFPTVIVEWDSLQPSFTEVVAGANVRHVPAIVRVLVHES